MYLAVQDKIHEPSLVNNRGLNDIIAELVYLEKHGFYDEVDKELWGVKVSLYMMIMVAFQDVNCS